MREFVPALPLLVALGIWGCNDSGAGSAETGAACTDEADNDGDGFTDCADQDCWREPGCGGGPADTVDGDVAPGDGVSTQDLAAPEDVPARDTTPLSCDPCGVGSLTGRACAPSQAAAVAGATVTVRGAGCDGQAFSLEVRSAPDGSYVFPEVPCGEHTLEVRSGSFGRSFEVQVATGITTDVGAGANKGCFGAQAARIAVLEGTWDEMQGLLLRLGLEYDLYNDDGEGGAGEIVALLSDPDALAAYDVIFANCGHTHGGMPKDHPAVMANVRDFILGGGSFYMSDYAWTYGEWAFPDAIEFQRSDDVLDMYTERSPQLIPSDTTVTARILDGNLSSYLGKTTMTVTFDSGPQIATETGGSAFTHVIASFPPLSALGSDFDPEDVPLVLSYRPTVDAGRVIYTNFHNDAQATEDMLKILTYLVFTL